MKEEQTMPTVMTERTISMKMAGYKASWMRKLNSEKTASGKKAIQAKMEKDLVERRRQLDEINQKAKWSIAGYRSWETRRANQAKKAAETIKETMKQNRKAGKKTVKNLKHDAVKSSSRKYNSTAKVNISCK